MARAGRSADYGSWRSAGGEDKDSQPGAPNDIELDPGRLDRVQGPPVPMVGKETHHQRIDQLLEESDRRDIGSDVLKKDHAGARTRHTQSLLESANRVGNRARTASRRRCRTIEQGS